MNMHAQKSSASSEISCHRACGHSTHHTHPTHARARNRPWRSLPIVIQRGHAPDAPHVSPHLVGLNFSRAVHLLAPHLLWDDRKRPWGRITPAGDTENHFLPGGVFGSVCGCVSVVGPKVVHDRAYVRGAPSGSCAPYCSQPFVLLRRCS